MHKILFLMADGFEEIEFTAVFDILIRGGVKVTLAGIYNDARVIGAHGLSIRADAALSELYLGNYQGVFLPGGSTGVENLSDSDEVIQSVQNFFTDEKWVTAICAAPKVLAKAKVISNYTVTSYPSVRSEVEPHCKKYSEERVVRDRNIITSRAAGTAEEFALEFLKVLEGESVSEKVRSQILAR